MQTEKQQSETVPNFTHLPAPGMTTNPFLWRVHEVANEVIVFRDQGNFERAITELLRQHFSSENMQIERVKNGSLLDSTLLSASRVAQGAAIGALFGLFVGLLLGASGTIGPGIFVDQPLAQLIVISVSSGIFFCTAGALIGLSILEYDAKNYASPLRDGNILVHISHREPSKVAEAVRILKRFGGYSVPPVVAMKQLMSFSARGDLKPTKEKTSSKAM
jgi:hypothetical protein